MTSWTNPANGTTYDNLPQGIIDLLNGAGSSASGVYSTDAIAAQKALENYYLMVQALQGQYGLETTRMYDMGQLGISQQNANTSLLSTQGQLALNAVQQFAALHGPENAAQYSNLMAGHPNAGASALFQVGSGLMRGLTPHQTLRSDYNPLTWQDAMGGGGKGGKGNGFGNNWDWSNFGAFGDAAKGLPQDTGGGGGSGGGHQGQSAWEADRDKWVSSHGFASHDDAQMKLGISSEAFNNLVKDDDYPTLQALYDKRKANGWNTAAFDNYGYPGQPADLRAVGYDPSGEYRVNPDGTPVDPADVQRGRSEAVPYGTNGMGTNQPTEPRPAGATGGTGPSAPNPNAMNYVSTVPAWVAMNAARSTQAAVDAMNDPRLRSSSNTMPSATSGGGGGTPDHSDAMDYRSTQAAVDAMNSAHSTQAAVDAMNDPSLVHDTMPGARGLIHRTSDQAVVSEPTRFTVGGQQFVVGEGGKPELVSVFPLARADQPVPRFVAREANALVPGSPFHARGMVHAAGGVTARVSAVPPSPSWGDPTNVTYNQDGTITATYRPSGPVRSPLDNSQWQLGGHFPENPGGYVPQAAMPLPPTSASSIVGAARGYMGIPRFAMQGNGGPPDQMPPMAGAGVPVRPMPQAPMDQMGANAPDTKQTIMVEHAVADRQVQSARQNPDGSLTVTYGPEEQGGQPPVGLASGGIYNVAGDAPMSDDRTLTTAGGWNRGDPKPIFGWGKHHVPNPPPQAPERGDYFIQGSQTGRDWMTPNELRQWQTEHQLMTPGGDARLPGMTWAPGERPSGLGEIAPGSIIITGQAMQGGLAQSKSGQVRVPEGQWGTGPRALPHMASMPFADATPFVDPSQLGATAGQAIRRDPFQLAIYNSVLGNQGADPGSYWSQWMSGLPGAAGQSLPRFIRMIA
jgi:hypothetical protein